MFCNKHNYTCWTLPGRRYDKHGNLRQWWSHEAITKFRDKKKCFINQYNQFVAPFSKLHVSTLKKKYEIIIFQITVASEKSTI